MGEKVGFKLSGEYFTARDFQYRDVAEPDTFPTAVQAQRERRVGAKPVLTVWVGERARPVLGLTDLWKTSTFQRF